MKKLGGFIISLLISTFFFFAFANVRTGGIMGKITPVDAASSISLVNGTDTVKAQITQGNFTFTNLKEGVYSIFINTNAPYKGTSIENVAVKDSATTDLGEIKLQQ